MILARFSGITRYARQALLPLAIFSVLLSGPALGQSAGRWIADEGQARAIMPLPRGETRVTGATLSCAAQRWRLDVMSEVKTQTGDATLVVDGREFSLKQMAEAENHAFALPRAAIEPLKSGLRLELVLPSQTLNFSLRGSLVAINQAQEHCTPRDMSAYTPVTFTPYSSYLNLGRELRQEDIAAFRFSTASEPKLDVAMAEFDQGRRVLFTRLCGSSWYYGASGCNITGFSPEGENWTAVYDTENVRLYTDPGMVTDGWPDLVTLPAGQKGNMIAGPGLIWRWDGKAYALKGELPEEPYAEAPVADEVKAEAAFD